MAFISKIILKCVTYNANDLQYLFNVYNNMSCLNLHNS